MNTKLKLRFNMRYFLYLLSFLFMTDKIVSLEIDSTFIGNAYCEIHYNDTTYSDSNRHTYIISNGLRNPIKIGYLQDLNLDGYEDVIILKKFDNCYLPKFIFWCVPDTSSDTIRVCDDMTIVDYPNWSGIHGNSFIKKFDNDSYDDLVIMVSGIYNDSLLLRDTIKKVFYGQENFHNIDTLKLISIDSSLRSPYKADYLRLGFGLDSANIRTFTPSISYLYQTYQLSSQKKPEYFDGDMDSLSKFLVYPNPTHEVINIISKGLLLNDLTITFFDLSGRKVLEDNYPSNKQKMFKKIDITSLSSGIYVLVLSDGHTIMTFTKIIKI